MDVGVLLVFNVQELTHLSHNFGLEVRKSVAWSLYIALGIPKRQINSPTNLSATVEASRFGTPSAWPAAPLVPGPLAKFGEVHGWFICEVLAHWEVLH